MRLNLNLATAPLENHRRFVVGAGFAGAVGVIALLILSHSAYRSWRANREIRADIARIENEINASERQQNELARYFDMPSAKQVLDRSAFLNSLIEQRTFPWPKIFDDLERTLPTGVRVVSIAPTLEGGHALVKLTIGAMDDEAKLKFLRALESSKVFTDVRVYEEKYAEPNSEGKGQPNDKVYITLDAQYATI
ncbi:MAG: hypothetical protein WA755_05500 [Candidatus Acidiferrales bacterium]